MRLCHHLTSLGPSAYQLNSRTLSKKKFFFFLAELLCLVPGGSDGKESACSVGDWVQSLGWEDPLDRKMTTHPSILVRKIPWTEEPGRLQSMGSLRVRHG